MQFPEYYLDFIRRLGENIWKFISNFFTSIYNIFIGDNIHYIENFLEWSNTFEFFDWVFAFVILTINIIFIVFLFIKIFQWLRRYVRFSKQELEKDQLLEEIAILSQKAVALTDEKNQILQLKMESFGMNPDLFMPKPGKEDKANKKAEIKSRFVKLINVDEQYKDQITTVNILPEDQVSLPQLVERFINYSASQLKLFYNKKVISTFFAGMATSKILILEGISGTGKTSLPYAMGKFFNHEAAIISVQPSWRDRSEMIGYLNEFTKRFNETDFLAALYETTYREDINIIVLDELNLARIEYYFAEFLSVMEMPNKNDWKIDIVPDTQPGDPLHLVEGKILMPQNVWFVGTANKDDSTFTITDKVYDRATSIEMNHKAEYVDAAHTENVHISYEYLNNLFEVAIKENPLSPKAMSNLEKLDDFIANKFKITFGNRIMNQIKKFVPVFVGCGGSEYEGLDYIVTRKILRKFETLNLPFLVEELNELITVIERLFGKGQFEVSIEFIKDLLKQI